MKARYLLASSVCATLLAASLLMAGEINLEGVKCVLNPKGPAKAENAVEYKGAKVFFCCQNCPKKFSEDPAKFATKANHQLVATKQAKQLKCPLSGQPTKEDKTVEVNGVNVAFCCANCQGKVAKAEGDEQLELVFSDKAFEKGFEIAKQEK